MSESEETEPSVINKSQAIQETPVQKIQVPIIQEIPIQEPTIQETSIQEIQVPAIQKIKSSNQSPKSSTVIAPFKPPCHPDNPMIAYYGKHRKPLSASNKTNIVIKLPPGIPSQSYSLNINLKLNP